MCSAAHNLSRLQQVTEVFETEEDRVRLLETVRVVGAVWQVIIETGDLPDDLNETPFARALPDSKGTVMVLDHACTTMHSSAGEKRAVEHYRSLTKQNRWCLGHFRELVA